MLALWVGPLWSVSQATGQSCKGDFNGDDEVTVDEIVTVVNNALLGCGQGTPDPTSTPTPPVPTRTPTATGPRFVDNGDGTVFDLETALIWEKKTGNAGGTGVQCVTSVACPDPHRAENLYTWSTGGSSNPSGTAYTTFLAQLNGSGGFAGHTDWRLPTSEELQTILVEPFECGLSPCIDITTFGPTASEYYWTSSTWSEHPSEAYIVNFTNGYVTSGSKSGDLRVRAVRTGP